MSETMNNQHNNSSPRCVADFGAQGGAGAYAEQGLGVQNYDDHDEYDFGTPGAGAQVPDAGAQVPDAAAQAPGAGAQAPDAGVQAPDVAWTGQLLNTFAQNISQSYPSICIPRTWSNVTWSLVKDAFEEIFGDGSIERVDVVQRQAPNGDYFNKIFIHFVKWPDTEYAQNIRKSLLDGKTIKLVYQFPWYWKCVLSNLPKRRWKGPAPYMEVLDNTQSQKKTGFNLVEEGFAAYSNEGVGGESSM